MYYLHLLHFFSFIIYLILGLNILYKNKKSPLHISAAGFLFSLAIWSLGVTFVRNIYFSKQTAFLFENISSIGWISFSSIFLVFSLYFSNKQQILKKLWVKIPIIVVPFLLFILQLKHLLIGDILLKKYGWIGLWSKSIYPLFFIFYYSIIMIFSLFNIVYFTKKASDANQKKQGKVLYTSMLISLSLGTFFSVILRKLNFYSLPPIADVFGLFWAFGVFYAIIKFKLFKISPKLALNQILETMSDGLFLLNTEGKIKNINLSILNFLDYKEDELIGKNIDELIVNSNHTSMLILQKNFNNIEITIKTKVGTEIPFLLSSSLFYDKNIFIGVVCIIHDIS